MGAARVAYEEVDTSPLHVRDHAQVSTAAARAAANDSARRAFERAVASCYPGLRASALRLTRRQADADDLLQETLLRAWRFWPRYREEDNCRAWLQRILNNTFCSEHRARVRRRAQLGVYAQHESLRETRAPHPVHGEPHRLVTYERLACSLSALSPGQRRILHLVDVDERSYRETAEALACPIGTVMSRLHRARAALRAELTRQDARSSCA